MKISAVLDALRHLPVAIQVAWGAWLTLGIVLTLVTVNVAQASSPPSPPELIFGTVSVDIPYGYFISAVGIDGRKFSGIPAQPARAIRPSLKSPAQNIVLELDVTNQGSLSTRLAGVFIEVREFYPVTEAKPEPVAAAGEIRGYYCNIRNSPGSYRAHLLDTSIDFIKLEPSELERLAVHVNTPDKGIYALSLTVEYTVGSETKRATAGRSRLVGFF